ncbi:MAG TPA: c-type cytochrome [Flavisolibacter sp.]|jgi:cytochrome c2/mono/diheme cytochrome c family protein|nr:c-type cytochrome [Flavisolibacter sp.]
MKKFLRYFLMLVLLLVVLAALGAVFISVRGIPSYKAEKINLHVDPTPARIVQGEKLASMLCKSCHFNDQTGKFTGRELNEVTQFGTIYSRNITRDKAHGIGQWTDGELAYLFRTGIRPDGTYLPPYMPKLVHLSDEDLYSIIAFLRSDHPWVAADTTRQPGTKPSFLTKFLTNAKIMKPFPYPKAPIPQPDTNNMVAWGKYIALGQLECYSCHSRDFAKNDYFTPENSEGFFGGGNEMIGMDGKKFASLNITLDEESGIGKWSEDDFVKAVRFAQVPNGQPPLRLPMQPYMNLTEKEVRAIYAYLKTVPKQQHKVERRF